MTTTIRPVAPTGAIMATVGAVREPPPRRTNPRRRKKRKPLGRLIGAFKTVSTKRINRMHGTPGERIWQRNFYERIVRNEPERARIRRYIRDNPRRWDTDRYRPP